LNTELVFACLASRINSDLPYQRKEYHIQVGEEGADLRFGFQVYLADRLTL